MCYHLLSRILHVVKWSEFYVIKSIIAQNISIPSMLLKHCVCICFRRACRIYNCHKAFILSRLAMKIDFSWQNTEFRWCYFINKTYETFLTSKLLNELALISLRWLYARWSTPSVLICCSYCNVQNTHICVKGNKKKTHLTRFAKKKNHLTRFATDPGWILDQVLQIFLWKATYIYTV